MTATPAHHAHSGFWLDVPEGWSVQAQDTKTLAMIRATGGPAIWLELDRLTHPLDPGFGALPALVAQLTDKRLKLPRFQRTDVWHRPACRGVGICVRYCELATGHSADVHAVIHPERFALAGNEPASLDDPVFAIARSVVTSLREHRDPKVVDAGALAVAEQHRMQTYATRESEGRIQAFLCHNSSDKPQVRVLRDALRLAGVVTWMDENQIDVGNPIARALETVLPTVDAFVIALGPHGISKWQDLERYVALSTYVARPERFRIIPVALPGGPAPEAWPAFLPVFLGFDFRAGITPERLAGFVAKLLGDVGG